MKKNSFFIVLLLLISSTLYAQVGINADNSTPDNSAMLDVKSATKGMLIPRMTFTERDAISNPANGLLVFCTDNNNYYSNKGTPSTPNWVMVSTQWASNGLKLYYNSGNIGLGTTNPLNKIDIGGNAVIGSGYSGVSAAPANGLLVEGQVGMGTTTPEASAALDVKSTSKGLLPPRMTISQIINIQNPADGLMVFCSTDLKYYIYISGISQWRELQYGGAVLTLPATWSIGTGGSCDSTVVTGRYIIGVALTTFETVKIKVNVTVAGSYSIMTSTFNGYSFSGSGIFSTTGTQTVTLAGSGAPIAGQTDHFTTVASNSGGSCTFDVNVVQCGAPFTDVRDGQMYNTVSIGTQCWMKENLNIGTMIGGSVDQTDNSVIEKYCSNNDLGNCTIYGGLYQWGEMVQYLNGASNTTSWNPVPTGIVQGICPAGWHIPSDVELCILIQYLDPSVVCIGGDSWSGTDGGGKMKETGTLHWASPNTGATNSSGFTALPAGQSIYNDIGLSAHFWSDTEYNYQQAWDRALSNDRADIHREVPYKSSGFSIRCVRD